MSASAENTFFRLRNVRAEFLSKDEAAIITGKLLFRPLKLKAISRIANRTGYKYFSFNM
jgi:hypothetical protein